MLVQGAEGVAVVGAGLSAAVAWCALGWWRGIPTSAGHALIGGLTGAAVAAEGLDGVEWGGLEGWKPVGVFGALFALVFSVVLGLVLGAVGDRIARRSLRRAKRSVTAVVKRGELVSAAALALGHGANDAQKSVGAIVALLIASGHQTGTSAPFWAVVCAAVALTVGTGLGGWPIVRTIGQTTGAGPPGRRTRRPGQLRGGRDRVVRGRRAGEHHPGAGLVGGGHRRRSRAWPPRAVGRRGPYRPLVGDHAAGQCDPWAAGFLTVVEAGHVKLSRWFLPDTPDVLGMLVRPGLDHRRGDGSARPVGRR